MDIAAIQRLYSTRCTKAYHNPASKAMQLSTTPFLPLHPCSTHTPAYRRNPPRLRLRLRSKHRPHTMFQPQPPHSPLHHLQRRNKRHLTPTKQRVPPPKHKHFESSRKDPIDPRTRPIHDVCLQPDQRGQSDTNGCVRRRRRIRPDASGVAAIVAIGEGHRAQGVGEVVCRGEDEVVQSAVTRYR